MRTIKLKSVKNLLLALTSHPNNFVYRGHSDAGWRLESSLERLLGGIWTPSDAQKYEDFALKEFRDKFHLYDCENERPRSKLAWLSIMQHHGVPTRLLDFTESPFVALYFAIESYDPSCNKDMAIYAVDYSATMRASMKHIAAIDESFKETPLSVYRDLDLVFDKVDGSKFDVAWITEPAMLNVRLDRQAGSFLIPSNVGRRIVETLSSPMYESIEALKYLIPGHLYCDLFDLLCKMNITSKGLYGDIDGLARSIRLKMKIQASAKSRDVPVSVQ
jgi:hypothetical protein